MIRTTARIDRRIDNDKAAADADRRAYQARFDTAMDAFRTEMQRLAERLSRKNIQGIHFIQSLDKAML